MTVKGLPCPSKFFVLPADALENEVTLGAQWQRTYKAYIHWYDNQVYFTSKNHVRKIPFVSEEDIEKFKMVYKAKTNVSNQTPITKERDIPSVQQDVTTDALQAVEPTSVALNKQVQVSTTTRWLPKKNTEAKKKPRWVWQLKCSTTASQTMSKTNQNNKTKIENTKYKKKVWIPKDTR